MELILSGLALLAASVCLILLVLEKKRNLKRNATLAYYVDTAIEEAQKTIRFDLREEIHAETVKLAERLFRLESGVVPDFEEAKMAARAVDDFNKGLSNILGFDPIQSLQKERQKAMGGETE